MDSHRREAARQVVNSSYEEEPTANLTVELGEQHSDYNAAAARGSEGGCYEMNRSSDVESNEIRSKDLTWTDINMSLVSTPLHQSGTENVGARHLPHKISPLLLLPLFTAGSQGNDSKKHPPGRMGES